MPRVRFLPDGVEVDVAPGVTLLQAALDAGARLGHACGGVGACGTCHVYVRSGAETLSDPEEDEEDALDKAFDVRPSSRLACRARVGEGDVTVEVTAESLRSWLDEHPGEAAPAQGGGDAMRAGEAARGERGDAERSAPPEGLRRGGESGRGGACR